MLQISLKVEVLYLALRLLIIQRKPNSQSTKKNLDLFSQNHIGTKESKWTKLQKWIKFLIVWINGKKQFSSKTTPNIKILIHFFKEWKLLNLSVAKMQKKVPKSETTLSNYLCVFFIGFINFLHFIFRSKQIQAIVFKILKVSLTKIRAAFSFPKMALWRLIFWDLVWLAMMDELVIWGSFHEHDVFLAYPYFCHCFCVFTFLALFRI